jgi:hypothetical protein
VEIAVREKTQKDTYRISVDLDPDENWLKFKMKLSGRLVGDNVIEAVAEVQLKGMEVENDNALVPTELEIGDVLALVTFGVL